MASSLSAFLETMYKKRALEYEAALNQSKADVAGAQAIGKGIENIGGAIGSIGQNIGGYMQQSQADKAAMAIGREEGVPLTSTGFGAGRELEMRMKAGQFENQSLTPYQQLQQQNANRNYDLDLQRENRLRQAGKEQASEAARRSATKSYTDSVANADAYQADSDANMSRLLAADKPEVFEQAARHQKSLNIGAIRAGIPESDLVQIPDQWIPPSNQSAFGVYREQQRFGQGTSNPAAMRQANEAYEASGSSVSYGNAPGQLTPPSMSTGVSIPPGAIPAGNTPRADGVTGKINGKPFRYDRKINYWVPY